MSRIFIACLSLILLSGCQTNLNNLRINKLNFWQKSDLSELPTYLHMAELNEQWSVNIKDSLFENMVNGKHSILGHQFHSNKLYITKSTGEVIQLNIESGQVINKFVLSKDISTAPVFWHDHIYIGTFNGEIHAYDKQLKRVWETHLLGEVLAAPRVNDAHIAAQTANGKLYLLDRKTGQELWQFEQEIPVLTIRGTSRPVIYQDVVLSGFANGKVVALDLKTGVPIWERRIAFPKGRSDLAKLVDINIEPIIAGGVMYIASYQGNIVALNVKTGELIWNKPLSTYYPLSLQGRIVAAIDTDDNVWALDRRNGKVLWQHKHLKGRKLTAVSVWDEVVAVADSGGYVHLLSSLTGLNISQSQVIDKELSIKPVVYQDKIYILNDKKLSVTAFTKYDERIERAQEGKKESAS